ncbi:hypothetical protein C0081_18615 [Cohaesibacter celericrescens]|uniref:Uncharacterized protein n=1 Tax=Cohaesibacter celericrescens TaxID=2067669 RepID=A0A2N5XMI9_9HYPH|nr:hypothetical protein C0081_18615 [Cohaesibacter celericrescens]
MKRDGAVFASRGLPFSYRMHWDWREVYPAAGQVYPHSLGVLTPWADQSDRLVGVVICWGWIKGDCYGGN